MGPRQPLNGRMHLRQHQPHAVQRLLQLLPDHISAQPRHACQLSLAWGIEPTVTETTELDLIVSQACV